MVDKSNKEMYDKEVNIKKEGNKEEDKETAEKKRNKRKGRFGLE
jgi:hypothetical protein